MEEQTVGAEGQTEVTQVAATETAPVVEKTFSQSELDRIIQKASQTAYENAEKKLAQKMEEQKLLEKGKYEELLKVRENELAELRANEARKTLEASTYKLISEKGLPELASVFENDISTLDGRTALVDSLKKVIEAQVSARVQVELQSKLKTPTVNVNNTTGTVTNLATAQDISKMSAEQARDYANQLGIPVSQWSKK